MIIAAALFCAGVIFSFYRWDWGEGNYQKRINIDWKKRFDKTRLFDKDKKFLPLLTDRIWGGVNNGDLFDEPNDTIDTMLAQMAKADLRVLRLIIDFRLEMDEEGNALNWREREYNDCILREIDDLMVKAKEKGILLFISLQHNYFFNTSYYVNEETHGWRQCQTPSEVYEDIQGTDESREVRDPYGQRGWATTYLTSADAKEAYKRRVEHVLNHVNPHFDKPWKDINDVIWAWGLHAELGAYDVSTMRSWFNEMATYTKGIDPDTYLALGIKYYDTLEGIGNISDADIYTIHGYEQYDGDPAFLSEDIEQFQETIGIPYGKLLLMEEFNSELGASNLPTPSISPRSVLFEAKMEEARKSGIPWMFWEYEHQSGESSRDDIWHRDREGHPHGAFWGSKIMPGAKRAWNTSWNWSSIGKRWGVHEMVGTLCSQAGSDCETGGAVHFVDTFGSKGSSPLNPDFDPFDEEESDEFEVNDGYLTITATPGQDLWGGSPRKRGAPLLLHSTPSGDYTVQTYVSSDPPSYTANSARELTQPLNTQMGLFIFENDTNWIFFGLTNHDFTIGGERIRRDGLIVTKTDNNVSTIEAEESMSSDSVFLKIKKEGSNWKFYWRRQNGEAWHNLATIPMTMGPHNVGMGVKTFDFSPHLYGPATAYFDYFMITR